MKLGSFDPTPPNAHTHPPHPPTHPYTPQRQQGGHSAQAFLAARPAVSTAPARSAARATTTTTMAAAHTLYDFPVSNNGGRCRVVIYDKGVQDQFECVIELI